jgi:PAS domain S-box-containing protein
MAYDRSSESPDQLRDLYQLLITHVRSFAIFLLDPEGCLATWNLGAERLLGYTSLEILGQPLSRFYPSEDVEAGVPETELRVAVRDGYASDDRWLVRKDGQRIWVSGVTVALKDDGLRGFGKIIHDQTAARRDKEEIQKLNEELKRVVQRLEESRAELQTKVLELEKFEEIVVGRELRMMALERELEQFRRQKDKPNPQP